jgi:hypothetical protein
MISGDSIVSVDIDQLDGSGTSLRVADSLSKMQVLPDGSLLIIGTDVSANTAWVFDPSGDSVMPVDLSGSGEPGTPWSEIAIDGNGRGIAVPQGTAEQGVVAVRAVDATDIANNGIVITTTSTVVTPQTTVLASATGSRSVFAWPAGSGLELSLWSNASESFISSFPVQINDAESLLSFDDQSGLLALRTAGGGVSIHDANNDFASLHVFADQTGPVAIDGSRDLMFAYSSDSSSLKVVDLSDGTTQAEFVVDLTELGTPAAISVGPDAASLVVQGSAGTSEIRLDNPIAREVTVIDGTDVSDVVFGIAVVGANTPPRYETLPVFETDEDVILSEAAPGAMQGAVDDQDDRFVLIQNTDTSQGTVAVVISGAMIYAPNLNFAGTDTFGVKLHDGRDMSDQFTLEIVVLPIPDAPSEIDISIDPVPENLQPGEVIGEIDIIDADGPGHVIEIDDPRFGAQGGQIIFNGGVLDFETEPLIPITVIVTDTQTNDVIEEMITVTLTNTNDPITGILPTESFVFENAPGDVIDELRVLDQDEEQFHTFTVDDERFMVEEFDLRLVPGVFLDYELESEVIVNVTATEVGGDNTYTQAITIKVRDLAEQPTGIGLEDQTVMELLAGAEVGAVSLQGASLDPRYEVFTGDARFEVVEGVLKLKSDQTVSRSEELEIQVEVTAVDTLGEFDPIAESFLISVLENETPAHNQDNPYDVNHLNGVTELDALLIINYLNQFGPGPVGDGGYGYCYDVNADGMVSALDALLVINHINLVNNSGGSVGGEGDQGEQEGGPEGEQQPTPDQPMPGLPPVEQNLRRFRIVEQALPSISDSQSASLVSSVSGSNPSDASRIKIELAPEFSISEIKIADLEETIVLLSRSK